MASQTVNVLRYSALGAGILYGFLHQRKIYAQAKEHKLSSDYAHKEALIAQAKAEYARQNPPKPVSRNGVISDPNDPRFELEPFLLKIAEETK
ncbi:ATP synthase E chain-domain-containing protein [Peziza echinospora]|nr:ATP synthase E chain-domain-containing protein [Peziza echinospora]